MANFKTALRKWWWHTNNRGVHSGVSNNGWGGGKRLKVPSQSALWSKIEKNTDIYGPLAHPFARSLAPLTRSLAPDCSLRSRAPLRSLAHFAHSLARGTVIDWMAIYSVFSSILAHSGLPKLKRLESELWRVSFQRCMDVFPGSCEYCSVVFRFCSFKRS